VCYLINDTLIDGGGLVDGIKRFKLFWLPSPPIKLPPESFQSLTLTADLKVLYVKYGFINGKCPQLTFLVFLIFYVVTLQDTCSFNLNVMHSVVLNYKIKNKNNQRKQLYKGFTQLHIPTP
jgi:hypothetical protein